jgi:hypothetical protein
MKNFHPLLILVLFIFVSTPGYGQDNPGTKVTKAKYLGKTQAIKNNLNVTVTDRAAKNKLKGLIKSDFKNRPLTLINDNVKGYKDPLVQNFSLEKDGPIQTDIKFEGLNRNETFQIDPPDCNGDVGKDFYVETTNAGGGTMVMVTDKQGVRVTAPFNLNSIWAQFNLSGFGDPIVLYDQLAERWLLSEFASIDQNTMMVAISATSDPSGSHDGYAISTPTFPDYPKFSVWPDAYMITTNEPEGFVPVYAMDRRAMIEGDPNATVVRLEDMNKFNTNEAFQVASPVDLTGNILPQEGTPHYTARIYDNSWQGGTDRVEIWPTTFDWENPENIKLGNPTLIPISPFESGICVTFFNCLDQPGPTNLAGLQHVIMHRAIYRNFNTHESILLNFSVDVDGTDRAGVRWVELRKTATDTEFKLYQEGTISADDGLNRFMASSAMDASGNIAIAYAVTNNTTPLSLRMTGRLATDDLGEMTFDETNIVFGSGNNGSSRWGDYFSMSVDPVDDRSFWFTGEYMVLNNLWGTKIAVFRLEKDSIDIAPVTIVEPSDSPDLGSNEMVQVSVKNFGEDTITSFILKLKLNGEDIVEDDINTELPPGEVYIHDFSQTVDMSVVGSYDFEIISLLADDANELNNSITLQRRKVKRNDVSLALIEGLGQFVCKEPVNAVVNFVNLGTETLQSLDIAYSLNGGPSESISWSGNVQQFDTGSENITISGLVPGSNDLTIELSNPNDVLDQDPANNSRTTSFEFKSDGQAVNFDFQGDFFSSQTTWELADNTGILFQSLPYENGGATFTEDWCLEEGCYTFTILDSGGDGLNIPVGQSPYYRMTDANGIIVAEIMDVNFGFFELQTFCLPFQCVLDFESSVGDATSAVAEDGVITINAINFLAPVEYSIDDGENFQTSNIFNNLSAGEYEILIKDRRGCDIKKSVAVDISSAIDELEGGITITIHPNPVKEKIRINIIGVNDNNELNFELMDINGKILQRRQMVKYGEEWMAEVSLIPYPVGTYLVRFRHPSFNKVYKVIKN